LDLKRYLSTALTVLRHPTPQKIASTASSQVAVLGIALITDIVLTRGLGPGGRGIYALAMLTVTLTVQVFDLGLPTATTYHVSRFPQDIHQIAGNSMVLIAVSGAVITVAGYVTKGIGFGLRPELQALPPTFIPVLAAAAVLTLSVNNANAILLGQQSILTVNASQILTAVIILFGTVGLGVTGHLTMVSALGVYASGRAAALVWSISRIRLQRFPTISAPVFRQCVRFASREYLSNVTSFVAYRVDQMILATMVSLRDIGFYAVATSVSERLNVVPNSVATVLLPTVASFDNEQRAVDYTKRLMRVTLQCSVVSVLALAALCPFLIPLVYGKAYNGAVIPLILLLPGASALAASKVLASHLTGRGRPDFTMKASIVSGALILVLDLILIRFYGIRGASVASALGYWSGTAMLFHYFRKQRREVALARGGAVEGTVAPREHVAQFR
jgi:O-antigen/teichoic acid export membrane protein